MTINFSEREEIMENWPNFFIVGAARAGTTSLYEYLKKIPEVYMSPEKEPHFFSKVPSGQYKIEDEKTYLRLFDGVKNEKAIGEASTTYLKNKDTPKRIHDKLSHAKIIIILRDPIDQLVSSYFFYIQEKVFKFSLHQEMLRGRIYPKTGEMLKETDGFSEQINRYLTTFGSDQVMIIIFEEFVKEPQETVKKVLKFLGINYNFIDFSEEVYRPYIVQNYEKLDEKDMEILSEYFKEEKLNEKDKEFLHEYFKEDVKKLVSILGRQLPWPNFKSKKGVEV